MLTPTTAPPPQITPEAHAELTSRTPASFADIPPILRWEGDAEIELASAQWAYWGNDASAPANGVVGGVQGRLYVTEEAVTFLPPNLPGFSLDFPALTLHALTPAGDRPAHIYCQIDEGSAEDEEYAQMGEMRVFVGAELLESLFGALSTCSALHDSLLPTGEPSSFFGFGDDDGDDDDDGDAAFEDADESGGRSLRSALRASFAQPRAPTHPAAHAHSTDGDTDSEVDAIAAFLQKVDWGTVPADMGGWVEGAGAGAGASGGAGASAGWVDQTPAAQLETARGRVAYLERLLKEEKGRVAELEAIVRDEGAFEVLRE